MDCGGQGQGHGVVLEGLSEGALERLEGRGQPGRKSRGGRSDPGNPWGGAAIMAVSQAQGMEMRVQT